MMDSDEIEVETTQIFKERQLKLRTVEGTASLFYLDVFESENPYIMIFIIQNSQRHSIRMDVQKDDLARELRLWLEGKLIRNPSLAISSRVDGVMQKFIKFGTTPKQEDLIMWVLSRSELSWGSQQHIEFGGSSNFSGSYVGSHVNHNQYPKTIEAAARSRALQIDDGGELFASSGFNDIFKSTIESTQPPGYIGGHSISSDRYAKSNDKRRTVEYSNDDDMGTFELTRKLLGKSAALSELSTTKVKGRTGARQTCDIFFIGSQRNMLGADIVKARKGIEAVMEVRRQSLEVAKVRREQIASKYMMIRDSVETKQQQDGWVTKASQELQNLHKIQEDIELDIKRQRNRAARDSIKQAWTLAPNGNLHRKGHSLKGPLLGPGPLPPSATSSIKDPRVTSVAKHFYWDSFGRRHERPEEEGEEGGAVEQAMEAIRRTAASASAYRLDFKQVFKDFDTSGDGFLSCGEMADAFLHLGVRLDACTLAALFKHFDPNESGFVHYGEFVWAFFNRRAMVRQWKRNTEHFTDSQLREHFHKFDVNGDGVLDRKEFHHLLLNFGITMTVSEQDTLVSRFDSDRDGRINMHEFFAFIEGERLSLHLDPQHEAQQLQRNIAKSRQASEAQPSVKARTPRRQSRSRSPTKSRRLHSDEGWRREGPPPSYPPDWDFSPSKKKPITSTGTYEGDYPPPRRHMSCSSDYDSEVEDDSRHRSIRGPATQSLTRRNGPNGQGEVDRRHGVGRADSSTSAMEGGGYDSAMDSGLLGLSHGAVCSIAGGGEGHRRGRDRNRGPGGDTVYTVIGEEKEGTQSYRTYVHSRNQKDRQSDEDVVGSEEAIWAAKMLQAQAHIETRLGSSYY